MVCVLFLALTVSSWVKEIHKIKHYEPSVKAYDHYSAGYATHTTFSLVNDKRKDKFWIIYEKSQVKWSKTGVTLADLCNWLLNSCKDYISGYLHNMADSPTEPWKNFYYWQFVTVVTAFCKTFDQKPPAPAETHNNKTNKQQQHHQQQVYEKENHCR